ncbi:MAG: rhodanese-like domain-containing protein, partial [Pontibacterium sp.]
HPKSTHNLNNDNLHAFLQEADMDKPLLVFCYHGKSSKTASDFLADQGFDHVYSVNGGFEAWRVDFPELCESATA